MAELGGSPVELSTAPCRKCGNTPAWLVEQGPLCWACLNARGSNKYHAQRTWWNGRWWASKHEAECAMGHMAQQERGEIKKLEFQVAYRLTRRTHTGRMHRVKVVLDFRWVDCGTGKTVVADAKGVLTDAARIKYAWFRERYGMEVILE